jgi:hypothetical protein
MRGRKGNLLSLSMIICWVSVKGNLANWNQRVVRVGPDFSNVKDVKLISSGVFFRHSLHKPVPGWVVSLLNGVVEVVSAMFGVFDTLGNRLFGSKVFYSLACLVVILDIVDVTFVIHPSESVR